MELISKEVLSALRVIIEEAEHMKNAYFWRSPKSASERRRYEQEHTHSLVEWEDNGHFFSAGYNVRCSCNNVYAMGEYFKDGKKTTLTAIRNSYNRMAKEV